MRRDQKEGQTAIDWRCEFEPGDYGKGVNGEWFARVPYPNKAGFAAASIVNHTVVEHEDGTITVSPSILMSRGDGEEWHGYLEKGIWRTV